MKYFLIGSFLFACLFVPQSKSHSQAFQDAGAYMDYISKANNDLTLTYLTYVSAVAHGKSARKVEKRRFEVLDAIFNTRQMIAGMPPWKGDRTYKDTTVAYLKILELIFREDYGKIVNMEEIAEQSYDAMEAYLLAQEKADEKLEEARLKQHAVTKRFAEKYGINLIETEDETSLKSKKAAELNEYYNRLYLIFFKPYKQELYILAAAEKGDLVALEQNISSLGKFASEAMEKLKEIKPFEGDPSLLQAAREALLYYKSASIQSKGMTDFFLAKEKFEKTKKAFETKRKTDRTQADIDQFNEGVNDINEASRNYNSLNQKLNKERSAMLDNWNKTLDKFMDQHMPVQKKVK
jgi:hypothetical protein